LVDILQPCVTYNKLNTVKWFKTNTYSLEESHDPHDRMEAFRRATEREKLPLGIFYVHPKPTFEEELIAYRENKEPLYLRLPDLTKVMNLIDSKRDF
jgi:2-oxoglutarate ferredoxin oxidoreductase subunit beta